MSINAPPLMHTSSSSRAVRFLDTRSSHSLGCVKRWTCSTLCRNLKDKLAFGCGLTDGRIEPTVHNLDHRRGPGGVSAIAMRFRATSANLSGGDRITMASFDAAALNIMSPSKARSPEVVIDLASGRMS